MSIKSYFFNKFNSISDNSNRFVMHCPVCNYVKKKTFSVYLESLTVHCFHADCNYHKSVIEFICEYEGITMSEAFALIGEIDYIKIQPEVKKNPVRLPEYYEPLQISSAVKPVGYYHAIAWKYVVCERRIPVERIEEYSIGYGVKNGVLFVIFPIFNELFELVYYIEREVSSKKYNFPKLQESEVSKTKVLFGIQYACNQDFIVICEGVFDALAIGYNAVALLGKRASEEQLMSLKSLNKPLIVALDYDAFKDSCRLCSELKGMNAVEIVRFPEGKDPADLGISAFSYILGKKETFNRLHRWKANE